MPNIIRNARGKIFRPVAVMDVHGGFAYICDIQPSMVGSLPYCQFALVYDLREASGQPVNGDALAALVRGRTFADLRQAMPRLERMLEAGRPL